MRVANYAEIPWRRFAEVRGAEDQSKDVAEEDKVGGRYRRLFRLWSGGGRLQQFDSGRLEEAQTEALLHEHHQARIG